ncbi:bifunctional diaminohydroxyphosphoribosylaminopyrimidine deaminase/5-amino-6-(5-phosphoribosylamino)uracil reductase RibD [Porticoccus sp.]|uniref:bifunctional diaminohydroxyphosphoribosylaminopyrimidine deaminase/5-amino-6-(5-phosphoribosylamino)uracil reductase RibD n=1 Tax=Porticoccus sp. TaxID=2024853 RepID=UPI003F69AB33
MNSRLDLSLMARALQLAGRGRYTTMPNPMVGCVIARGDQVIGEGWHECAGEPHAEIHALSQAGGAAKGATAYVTLEPCSHYGRTPPCAGSLISAGIARVVYAVVDPNPKVAGVGLETLRRAGITVDGPVLEDEALQLNRGFIKRHQHGRPWVTVKLAMSMDARTAMANGESRWITGAAARSDVQRLRAQSCAIITGSGTVLHDNPLLTVRAAELGLENAARIATRQPLRVVVCGKKPLSSTTTLLNDGGRTLLVTAGEKNIANVSSVNLDRGDGRVDLAALLRQLSVLECNGVLVEAGAALAGAFVSQGLADELIIYMAPTLLGSLARPMMVLPFENMDQKLPLKIRDIRMVGDDLRITATPPSFE